jgi:hypothetical protein
MNTLLPRFARLHVLTLCAFAIAQPLYDLIGRNSQFLVAHGIDARGVTALVLILSFGIGLALVAALEGLRVIGPRARLVGQYGAVALLCGLIVAGPLRRFAPWVAFSGIAAGALAGAAFYLQRSIRTFLTVLSPAIAIFPIVFLLATPVSRIIRPAQAGGATSVLPRQPPIVLVVFDEFSTFDMLDGSGSIDAARFPALASLAATATWFPNALLAFPYTERAIPAILSGVAADGNAERLPILADHPQNLFTWLSGSYVIHASEPVTSLCPATCVTDTASARPGPADFATDVAILYLHLVTPRSIAERRLPSLAGTWARFSTAGAVAAPPPRPRTFDIVAAFERASAPGRATLFRRFVEGVANRSQPALHFIHVLLPHDPYVATPQGHRYAPGGLTEGMGADGVWTTEQPLLDTGRQRHLAQARLTDRLLGELLDRLRREKLFDDALIIVTADHGAAFKPGESHRGMTASNAAEIQTVPMLVKLPRQRQGAVNERPVSGLDIAPTIADALGTALPWAHDGHAMLADDYPPRAALVLKGTGMGPLPLFDVRAAAREGRFGAPALQRTSPAFDLLGTTVREEDLGTPRANLRVFSEDFSRLESVDLTASIPALITGEVQSDRPHADPFTLALVLNGEVAAVTRTVQWRGSPHYFTALLPGELLRQGGNRLTIGEVGGTPGARTLTRLSDDLSRGLTLIDGVPLQIATGGGTRLAVGATVTGAIDRTVEEPDLIRLFGWAADLGSAAPLRAIVAFSGNRAVAVTSPHDERPDVTAALSLQRGQKVSFALEIPRRSLSGPVRVFGLSVRGEAGAVK